METVSEFADSKTQLEERIRSLEEERAALQRDVESLNGRLTIKSLEKNASSLESEVQALRGQKSTLEEQLDRFSPTSTEDASSPQVN